MHTVVLRALAPLLALQFGVVSRDQLRAAGASDAVITRWVDARLLHRVHPGVYAVGHRTLTLQGRWMAAQLWAGDDGVLGYWTAAMVRDLWAPRAWKVHVIVPRTASARSTALHVHRPRIREGDVGDVGPFRVTTWARTIVDCADIASQRQVEALLDRSLQLRVYDHGEMLAAVDAARRRRGRTRLVRALDVLAADPVVFRSWTERRVRDGLRPLLPPAQVNHRFDRGGTSYELDLFWPEAMLNVEIDGPHHEQPFQRRLDAARDAWLEAQGVLVLRYPVAVAWPERIAREVGPLLAARRAA